MRCRACKRILRNPESIALGIGPVCGGRDRHGQGELFDEEEEMDLFGHNMRTPEEVQAFMDLGTVSAKVFAEGISEAFAIPVKFLGIEMAEEGPPSIYALLVAETRSSLSEVRAIGRKHPEMLYSLESWEARLLNLLKKVEEV